MYDDGKELYRSGYYLHRLYLTENPLLQQNSVEGKTDRVKKLVEKQIDILRQKEDIALKNLAQAFLGPDNATAENGLHFLEDFVSGDGKSLLNKIIQAFIDTPHDTETNKYIFSEEQQSRIIKATIDALEDRFGGTRQEFDKSIDSWQSKLEKSLMEIKFDSKKGDLITSRPAAALEGDFFERIVPVYFNLLFEEVLKSNNGRLEDWMMLDAEFTGQNRVENAVLALDKKQPFDVNIKLSLDDIVNYLPIQVKAKPMSMSKEINLYTHMNIVDLIGNSLTTGQQDALRTAIINQHYWSQGAYRDKVDAVAKKLDVSVFKGRGHPTAIERLDVNNTLGPMKPVVPLMRYAIIYNLITGINNVTDQLLYIIVGKGKTSAVLRSSDIIRDVLNDVMSLGISGHAVGKIESKEKNIKVPTFIDTSIYRDYTHVTGRRAWYSTTAPKMEQMFNKITVTATLNYGIKD